MQITKNVGCSLMSSRYEQEIGPVGNKLVIKLGVCSSVHSGLYGNVTFANKKDSHFPSIRQDLIFRLHIHIIIKQREL